MKWKQIPSPTPKPVAIVAALALMSLGGPVVAHHSYAMFDLNKPLALDGRVAKVEWINPHISLWLYAPKAGQAGQYDLWRFQSDSPGMASRHGWSKTVLKVGDRITMHYFPLNNGGKGGYLIRVVRPDGSELIGDPDAPGVARELAKTNSLPKRGGAR
ncbi:MAG: hypothetical protein BGP16_11665 [Sphingobium sp. 66-54]|nr:MAG: hypothetical protein BGP16_11665 [Sphingobium sp. 66-54]